MIQDASQIPTAEGVSRPPGGLANPIRILYWNIHKKDLSEAVSILANDLDADVIVLLEHPGDPGPTMLLLQQQVDPDFAVPSYSNTRFVVFSRLPFPHFEEVFYSSRFSIRRFRHEGICALLAIIHGPDPINYDMDARTSFACEMMRDLRQAMKENQTTKVVIIGDFNLNPYDAAMNQATGFNAMMTKSCVAKGTRKLRANTTITFTIPCGVSLVI
jgi:hypothetical protein